VNQLQHLTAEVAISLCWAVFVLTWAIGAAYNAFRGPRRSGRAAPRPFLAATIVVAALALAVVRLVPADGWQRLRVDSPWATIVGLAVLLPSTAFALWARVALGTMWSLDPVVKEAHQLRTEGPYGITRHPIYTGMLGMFVGSVLLAGGARSILVLPVAVVLFEAKINAEEGLLSAAFPQEYRRYRQRVPQLIPGLGRLRRRHRAHNA
jgi:protein-S-isoprenylcysteine O-methyltransferase Ste14